VLCGDGGDGKNSKFDIAVIERNAEIKYDKDTRKIKNKFIYLFSWKLRSLS